MKILVVAQNVPWSSWNTKINLLKEWYKPIIDLTVDLLHVNFSEVKFDRNVQVDRKWMETNIIPRAKGYDLVYFQMNVFDWKAYPMQAAYLGKIGGIHVIEGGHEEFGDYNFFGYKYPGDLWFNLARHELAHALYFIQGKGNLDRTHEYYETNRIDKLLEDLKTTKPTTMKYRYFKDNEIVGLKPELVKLLDDARHIAGTPFKLNSGYRTKAQNKKVGGVEDSAHLSGLAVDIACTTDSARHKIITALQKVGFNRIGIAKTFVHCDLDKSKSPNVIWLYE